MKSASYFLGLFITLLLHQIATAQNDPFEIYLEPMQISGLGGLQAYAFGQHNDKCLLIGGRLDGLHRRQPFAAFDIAGNNNQLIVVDFKNQQKWTAPISALPVAMQEQLSSTNMEFHQEGEYLYIIGGYGYNAASASKKTFAALIAIHLPDAINAVINATNMASAFRQVNDAQFAVCGGHLKKINDTYYLLGGNQFDGDYNPMGNPTYTQVYTNAVRKFTLIDDGINISITHLNPYTDSVELHRRDYNAVPQILPNGTEGIVMFSGVFQKGIDLPYLSPVVVDSISHSPNNSFLQHYNHYHCAVLPLYSASNNNMHAVFFGGIAQFYDSAGILVQDNNVPFVKTVARVSSDANGQMAEYKLPIEMPSYLGASAELIPNLNEAHYKNEVFKLDDFSKDSTLVGYIFGGINSTAANVFFTNNGTQSSASAEILKVYVIKNKLSNIHELNTNSNNNLQLYVYPNLVKNDFHIRFRLRDAQEVRLKIMSSDGRLIEDSKKLYEPGEHILLKQIPKLHNGSAYFVSLETKHEKALQKIIIE